MCYSYIHITTLNIPELVECASDTDIMGLLIHPACAVQS